MRAEGNEEKGGGDRMASGCPRSSPGEISFERFNKKNKKKNEKKESPRLHYWNITIISERASE